MEGDTVALAMIGVLTLLLPAMINYYANRKREAEKFSDTLIEQMQEHIRELRRQQDEDRAKYADDRTKHGEEIAALRAEIDAERAARLEAEKVANEFRARFEEATLDRVDRIQRIRELEKEIERLTQKVKELEKRGTGELKE